MRRWIAMKDNLNEKILLKMDCLPEPSNSLDDEWANMKMRFSQEGVTWAKLNKDERLLQVWRWMSDSETNLRTARLQGGKVTNANKDESKMIEQELERTKLNFKHLEEKVEKLKEYKKMSEERNIELEEDIRNLQEDNKNLVEENNNFQEDNRSLEDDNINLAINLKVALEELDEDKEERLFKQMEEKLEAFDTRMEAIVEGHRQTKQKYKEKLALQKMDFERQVDDLERKLKTSELSLQVTKESLEAERKHSEAVQNELNKAHEERIEMAKTCLKKDEEVSITRRDIEEAEDKINLVTKKNKQLLEEILQLKSRPN